MKTTKRTMPAPTANPAATPSPAVPPPPPTPRPYSPAWPELAVVARAVAGCAVTRDAADPSSHVLAIDNAAGCDRCADALVAAIGAFAAGLVRDGALVLTPHDGATVVVGADGVVTVHPPALRRKQGWGMLWPIIGGVGALAVWAMMIGKKPGAAK